MMLAISLTTMDPRRAAGAASRASADADLDTHYRVSDVTVEVASRRGSMVKPVSKPRPRPAMTAVAVDSSADLLDEPASPPPAASPAGATAPTVIRVLIIAMNKKLDSKPMRNILDRLRAYPELTVACLRQDVFLADPIESWPPCDALIAYFSSGFPLTKVEAYARLHRPFMVNDLASQHFLLDRRAVYRTLLQNGIPVSPHFIVDRDNSTFKEEDLIEADDHIEFQGKILKKPFVEKPADAEDHNIVIYFHSEDGGGSQHLFRKVQDRSSEFRPDCNTIRRDRSYIYETFITTGGTDVKVYTVGMDYTHAEARKSPAVDGKVLRDADGKEIRFPVMLTPSEKLIARKIVLAFKQRVCGFDLLRTRGATYVCDVNGWSFVKQSKKYYKDAAQILRYILLGAVAPDLLHTITMPKLGGASTAASPAPPATPSIYPRELVCVIGVIRHGDRSPKQKMKMEVTHPKLLALYLEYATRPRADLTLKSKTALERVLVTAEEILAAIEAGEQGITEKADKLSEIVHVLARNPIAGIYRKVCFKPKTWAVDPETQQETLVAARLVLKWGGELTDIGCDMAVDAGHWAREHLYPNAAGPDGLLRLHSTFRHDLKIYSSQEGRVQTTAAAFAKGLLDLEGDLTPILTSLVRKDDSVNEILDSSGAARELLDSVKDHLHEQMSRDCDAETVADAVAPDPRFQSQRRALEFIDNPRQAVTNVYELVQKLCARLSRVKEPVYVAEGEHIALMHGRWLKLANDLFDSEKGKFNISKLPDVYDSVKYDMLHNSPFIDMPELVELLPLAKALADVIMPQEYGQTVEEKLAVGRAISQKIIAKILYDLRTACGKFDQRKDKDFMDEPLHRGDTSNSEDLRVPNSTETVRSRFYFTSESHINSIINLLRLGSNFGAAHSFLGPKKSEATWERGMQFLSETTEWSYLTHIVFRVWRVPQAVGKDGGDDEYYVELSLRSGQNPVDAAKPTEARLTDLVTLHAGVPFSVVDAFLTSVAGDEAAGKKRRSDLSKSGSLAGAAAAAAGRGDGAAPGTGTGVSAAAGAGPAPDGRAQAQAAPRREHRVESVPGFFLRHSSESSAQLPGFRVQTK